MIRLDTVTVHHGPVHVLEGGRGPDLVYLHDAAGITGQHPVLAALARRYHLVAPLLPGYGASAEAPGIRDMLDVTLHTFDVIAALGLERPLLVGHSLGGMIAAEMAAIAPEQVERLCLIAPAGLWLDEHPIADIFSLLPSQFPALLFHDPEAGARIMTAGLKLDDPAFLIPFLVNNARQLGMAGKFLFPIPERGLKDRLYRIRAKTLLLWGASDRLIPEPYAQAFLAAIRGAKLVTVPRAGHLLPLERPDAVVAALDEAFGAKSAAGNSKPRTSKGAIRKPAAKRTARMR